MYRIELCFASFSLLFSAQTPEDDGTSLEKWDRVEAEEEEEEEKGGPCMENWLPDHQEKEGDKNEKDRQMAF